MYKSFLFLDWMPQVSDNPLCVNAHSSSSQTGFLRTRAIYLGLFPTWKFQPLRIGETSKWNINDKNACVSMSQPRTSSAPTLISMQETHHRKH